MIEAARSPLATDDGTATPVTMAQLARELGVSKNTVSLSLRHDPQIPLPTRNRVQAAARRLGYTTNPVVAHLMAELRRSRTQDSKHTLALINAHRHPDAFKRHPTIPAYFRGCRRRAAALGYGVDSFWLHDPDLDGARFNRILRARGIQGVVVIGLTDDNRLPDRFAETWAKHACVSTGVRTQSPTLSFCCPDYHALVLRAMEEALLLGYRRPGLAIPRPIDRALEGRFSAGMWIGQLALPSNQRVAHFYDVDEAKADPAGFNSWLEREQPDVIFTLGDHVRHLVEKRGLRVPQDVGLIQLELRCDHQDWAGMDQHHELAAEAAVDMVVDLLHGSQLGIPSLPRATFIEASWTPGKTVRSQGAVRDSAQASQLSRESRVPSLLVRHPSEPGVESGLPGWSGSLGFASLG